MRQNGTGWNGEGANMPSDGNKEEEGDRDVIIVFHICGTSRSRGRIKRGTEHLVSLRSVSSHVPNNT
ncbi:hypothetical protein DVH24_033338 [Malus domestica]|uniref:Uncharacterized protein n=1 Tax=Malus domestica TaxID=3750 RepID=A0A498JFB9_MALDO|nr:hypothetical protein DVH24_033338 [Malus domestica]